MKRHLISSVGSAIALVVCLNPVLVAAQEAAASAAVAVNQSPEEAKAAAKAAKAAAAAEAKKQRELQRLYGLGPYPVEIDAFVSSRPEKLRPLYRTLYTGGERNAVLNLQRLGLAAIRSGEWGAAEWAFDKALMRIEAIYADNPQANAARSSFHNEANKDFKGEPYERSMAYYYRGLLYLRAGDYDNARASFKGAEYQDTLSEAETYQGDFAIMNYLVGWTQKCQGQTSSAEESFGIATKAQEGLAAPAAGDNVLFLAEIGNGPVKTRGGSSEEMLQFGPGPAYEESGALFTLTGGAASPAEVRTLEASSVTYQATTRGGRAIDGIMKGKANLKQTTGGIGSAAIQAGVMQGGDAGMASMGIGLAMSLFASAMKTKADIRQWDDLPDQIMVGTAKAKSPKWSSTVTFVKGDQKLETKPGGWMQGDAKGCSFVWAQSRPNEIVETIVGEDAGVARAVAAKKDVQKKNLAFRQWLEL